MSQEVQNVLGKAADCFKHARGNLMQGARYLHQISTQELWQGAYSSFNEFLETECQISPGYASKLIKSYEYYVVGGGISLAKLQSVDPEKLYLAISLPGRNTDEKLVKAETWNRQELKDELASGPDGDCSHKVLIIKHQCKACSRFIDVN